MLEMFVLKLVITIWNMEVEQGMTSLSEMTIQGMAGMQGMSTPKGFYTLLRVTSLLSTTERQEMTLFLLRVTLVLNFDPILPKLFSWL